MHLSGQQSTHFRRNFVEVSREHVTICVECDRRPRVPQLTLHLQHTSTRLDKERRCCVAEVMATERLGKSRVLGDAFLDRHRPPRVVSARIAEWRGAITAGCWPDKRARCECWHPPPEYRDHGGGNRDGALLAGLGSAADGDFPRFCAGDRAGDIRSAFI